MMVDLRRDEPCPECGRFANRGVSIDAVIVRDGNVLLIERGIEPDKGAWATPGGYVDWDETVEGAVEREIREETGLEAVKVEFLGVRSEPDRHPKQVINMVFLVGVAPGDPQAGDDAADVAWFAFDALPDRIALDHRTNLDLARQALAVQ